ncbi:MAG TPA: virulence RhuM family protein [Kofleriaceae bacterium]|nr:virulence RhuM family protein [Kofleriaceae bacterium]
MSRGAANRSRQKDSDEAVALAAPEPTEFLLYQTEDGLARVHIRLSEGTVWLTQKQLAELYQTGVPSISEHLTNIFREGELDPEATIRKFRTLRKEGNRSISRVIEHYSLPVVLAVGYRVRSARGTQFRQWATTRLEEYVVKGFTLDDQRLKNPSGPDTPDYFEELLQRIREIRSSEKVFYRKILDIYATSVDYDSSSETSARFFAAIQNKMHWAVHGHTAAELIAARADAGKPNLGLTAMGGSRPRRADIGVAKNYLTADEIATMNKIVTAYLEFAELQALNRRPMHMHDWITKLDEYLKLSERKVLATDHVSTLKHAQAVEKAQRELDKFNAERAKLSTPVDEAFETAAKQIEALARKRPGAGAGAGAAGVEANAATKQQTGDEDVGVVGVGVAGGASASVGDDAAV